MAAAIRRFVLELRKSPSAARLVGFIPMYYLTGEWQYADPGSPMGEKSNDYRMAGFDENHRSAFAAWAVEKHGSLDAVNAAWGTRYGGAAISLCRQQRNAARALPATSATPPRSSG